jgi:hypothetical protein
MSSTQDKLDKNIFLPTIMHTGTQFCRTFLFDKEEFATGYGMKGCHVDDAGINHYIRTELTDEHIIVVPIRHPYRVYHSFLKRNKDKNEFMEQWMNMLEHIHPLNPWYIHIDLEERIQDLARLEKFLNHKFKHLDGIYAWEVVNSKAGTHKQTLEELATVEVPQEFIEYYEYTRKK